MILRKLLRPCVIEDLNSGNYRNYFMNDDTVIRYHDHPSKLGELNTKEINYLTKAR